MIVKNVIIVLPIKPTAISINDCNGAPITLKVRKKIISITTMKIGIPNIYELK